MEKTYVFKPHGVCSREMHISYDGETITGLEVIGGCHGNLQGLAALSKGRRLDELVTLLKGIDCHGRGTSCPDQFAKALEQIIAEESQAVK